MSQHANDPSTDVDTLAHEALHKKRSRADLRKTVQLRVGGRGPGASMAPPPSQAQSPTTASPAKQGDPADARTASQLSRGRETHDRDNDASASQDGPSKDGASKTKDFRATRCDSPKALRESGGA